MLTATARIACVQLAPRIADVAANRVLTTDAIDRAVRRGADLVVLPELATSGYVFDSPDEASSVALPPTDTLFEDWAAAAGGATVVGGFCELGDDGQLFNSAAVVDQRGVRAIYRKTHLWDTETRVFTPGTQRPPIVDTPVARVGVLVCYDLEFPELTRSLALRGAEVVAVPVNWPLVARPDGERPPEVLIAMATARVNRMAIACCDRSGDERGQAWTEGTTVVDASGWVVAVPDEDALAVADIDLAVARDKRLSDHNDALGDRRPDLYS